MGQLRGKCSTSNAVTVNILVFLSGAYIFFCLAYFYFHFLSLTALFQLVMTVEVHFMFAGLSYLVGEYQLCGGMYVRQYMHTYTYVRTYVHT